MHIMDMSIPELLRAAKAEDGTKWGFDDWAVLFGRLDERGWTVTFRADRRLSVTNPFGAVTAMTLDECLDLLIPLF